MDTRIQIAPSILSADFAFLGDAVRQVEEAGADMLHVDIMDGSFVPNITVGPLVVEAIHKVTKLPLDVHLMIVHPEYYLDAFAKAGADFLTVHPETGGHLHCMLQQIKSLGIKAGVALNPGTTSNVLEYILPLVDLVLVMTVNPGFGGQAFIPEMLGKIKVVRQLLDKCGRDVRLSVDGGINTETAPQVVSAGANILVAGTAVFDFPRGIGPAIAALREVVYE
ncbi:MAG: ribulose-phosphate 3-epimerase [Anaerolineae bacterium]|nr:ribulose-phosphate 3-epimerase [Anaerolineae bacterium]